MTNQQGAPEAPSYEHAYAIMQGERNASLDAYSRVVSLTRVEERLYETAFTNGWNRLAALVDAQQPAPSATSKAVLAAIRAANMQLVRTGDDEFMLVTYKQATPRADSVTAPAGGVVVGPILAAARCQLSNMRAQRKSLEGFLALGNEVSRAAHLDEEIKRLADALDAAQAADSVLEDAARYRFLRDSTIPTRGALTGAELDKAVDEYRKQGGAA